MPGVSGGSLPTTPRRAKRADFGTEQASDEVLHVANWAVDSGDHGAMPFVVVDKVSGKVFVFDSRGSLRGAASALVGSARGDKSVPGIGSRKLSSIRPHERTTPAGRFVASLGRSLKGEEILWVDYEDALALHRVIATVPKERRLERLASKAPLDRRITYGCINVPVGFYDTVVIPMFRGTSGIVYILPESQSAKEFFGSYDVGPDAAAQAASSPLPAPR